ncbi:transcription antitermination factor NusB [Ulvibacter litoralis]|uniref:N utilization substance protein B n=1 Tax=Ulvibacter litoralis TaxID=227084 RepID=A0A1G7GY51_9FLAO|nr:transcription antitermination factor NusB [Ulvibacter litoralis]GHC59701.1 N utilization substance protein B [Ulvibacter litoralis]SDE93021.1 N utilization substance protein B [Ulvibacter litoralis]
MLTRRHIRVKVVQSIYAYNQTEHPDLGKQEKFLFYSIEQMLDLYLLTLQLLVEMRDHAENFLVVSQKKHLATALEKNPSKTFIDNKVLRLIGSNSVFMDTIDKKGLNYWAQDAEYVAILFNKLKEQDWYNEYLLKTDTTYKEDQAFVVKMFKDVIAPNDKFYEYLEDKRLTWIDDFPIVNTAIVKMLSKLSEKNVATVLIPELYKDIEDRDFALQLLRKVILNDEKLSSEIDGKTPNWDKERIAEIDMIILKLGIAEFLYFPSIPVRATINEYLEISKEYSTPKSSIFINGILDKLVKEFESAKKLNKIGRGLK